MTNYIREVNSRVHGIPCIIGVTYYQPADPGRISGPPERCWPAAPMELEYDVLTTRGKLAPWLEKLMTEEDKRKVEEDVEEDIEDEKCEAMIAQREDEEEWYPYR